MKNTATINKKSPRYADWLKVFGSNVAPIIGYLPRSVKVLDQVRDVYMLDLEKLTPDQMRRLIEHLATRFGLPVEEVKRDLPAIGCPILAEDLIITHWRNR